MSKIEEEVKKQWLATGIKPEEISKKLAAEKDIILGKATKLLNEFLKSDLEKTQSTTPVMIEISPCDDDSAAVEQPYRTSQGDLRGNRFLLGIGPWSEAG